jgi:hypothetical protein
MERIVLVLVTGVNLLLMWWHLRFARQRQLRVWLLPSSYFLVTCFLNFVFRGWILVSDDTGSIDTSGMSAALVYYALFMTAFIASTVVVFSMSINGPPARTARWSGTGVLICIMFTFVLSEFAYRAATGSFRGLYAAGADEGRLPPVLDRIYAALLPMRWFLVGLCVVAAARRPSNVLKGIMAVTGLLFLAEAIVTTSKGAVVNLILIHFLWAGMNGRKFSKIFMAGALAFAVVFSLYSYLARYHDSSVYQAASVDTMTQRFHIVQAKADDYKDKRRAVDSLLGRFAYLDGLMLCVEKFSTVNREDFVFGSLGEVPNLVPRFVWSDKPNVNFNRYLTKNIWGADSPGTEMPVGRIGESYFVLSWVGLLYAPLTAVLFWALYYYLFHRTSSPFLRSLFLMLLMTYCIPDQHLFSITATLLMWCAPVLIGLKIVAHTLAGPEDDSSATATEADALPAPQFGLLATAAAADVSHYR